MIMSRRANPGIGIKPVVKSSVGELLCEKRRILKYLELDEIVTRYEIWLPGERKFRAQHSGKSSIYQI